MLIVQSHEIAAFKAERPLGDSEDQQSIYFAELGHLEDLFEEDIVPTMRYSFVVFLHTVFESQLRAFCNRIQRERTLPLGLNDVRGSAMEQARTYLAKMISIPVREPLINAGGYPGMSKR